MESPVRLPRHARASIDRQLPASRVESFVRIDLSSAIDALLVADWWALPVVSAGLGVRRFTVAEARTVAGFHLLVGLDPWADDPAAMVIHVIDIWTEEWPSESD